MGEITSVVTLEPAGTVIMRGNVPWGAMTPRGVYCVAGAFSGKEIGPLAPRGDTKKREKKHPPLTRTRQQLWLMFGFGTGDTVVTGVGIADGPRVSKMWKSDPGATVPVDWT